MVLVYFKQILPRESSTITCTHEECVWRGGWGGGGCGLESQKNKQLESCFDHHIPSSWADSSCATETQADHAAWGWVCTHIGVHIPGPKQKKKKNQSIRAHKVMSKRALCPSQCRLLRARGAPRPRLLPCCHAALCSAARPSPSPAFICLF